MDPLFPNIPELPSSSRIIPMTPLIPILEEEPFKYQCEHRTLLLRKTEKYAYLTRLNKVYSCVDCGNTFSVQPTGKPIFHLNNNFQ